MEVIRSKEGHPVGGVLLAKGIPMTQQLAGGPAPIVEDEVIAQKHVATRRVKTPRNWQKKSLKRKCSSKSKKEKGT